MCAEHTAVRQRELDSLHPARTQAQCFPPALPQENPRHHLAGSHPNTEVLARAGTVSMYALLTKRRLRWLGHVTRMQDGRLPKDILYGELATGSRPTGRPSLRYKDVLKRDLNCASRLRSTGSGPQRLAIHHLVSHQDSRAEKRGAVGRQESSQAPESRGQPIPLGRQRLRMQQLQQDLPLEDRSLQPQPALQLHHRLTMGATLLSPETEGRQ